MQSSTNTSFKTTFQPPNRPNPWSVLKHRDYRLFWLGQTVSSVGTFMQVVGQSLLVLKLSHNSALALGMVSLAQALAFFAFALIGGSVVDRVNRRKLLFVTQTLLLVLALALAIMSATNTATLPLVIVLAFCSGVVVSFDQPARASLFPRLVPREELSRATALNALAMTSAGTFGPALAGFTAATLGLSVNFSLNASSFVFALICLALIRTEVPPLEVAAKQPLLGSVREGLRVVVSDPALLWIVSGYAALLLLGPSPSVLLPLYAAQVLHVDGAQLGLLFLMVGAGTLLASAAQAAYGGHDRQSGVFVVSLFVWAFALAVFALSSSLVLSAIALLLHGAARNVVGTTAVTMMQLLAPEQARGRVMSLNTLLAGGLRPLGDFGLSAVMAATSLAATTLICAGLVGLYALVLNRPLSRLGHEQAQSFPRATMAREM
jgi:MFS family permease